MKLQQLFLFLVVAALLGASLSRSADSPAADGKDFQQTGKSDRDVEMANLVLAKTFCVAMRRNDHARLRQMIDPAYLKSLNLDKDAKLPIEIAPVLGIHHIIITRDRQAALCLYGTQQGDKETMLLRTRWNNGRLYVAPSGPPDPETGLFQPWSLRANLNRFLAKP